MLHLACMMQRYSLLLLALFAALCSTAQTFNGKVTDETGMGLPGAFVTAKNAAGEMLGNVSLPDGTYVLDLSDWAGQSATVSCSYIGMETQERSVNRLETGAVYTWNWTLESTSEVLDLVVVSAGRFEQSAAEVTCPWTSCRRASWKAAARPRSRPHWK